MKKIALFGGSFNPPGIHHRNIATELLHHFDEVIIIPCGPRPDKESTDVIDSIDRAAMVDLAFKGLPVRIELFDLENSTFTRTHALDEIYRHEGEIWHVIGTDLIEGGRNAESFIHRVWFRGEEIWNTLRFAILQRPGYTCDPADLPPHHMVLPVSQNGSSSDIRERIFKRHSIEEIVSSSVADYIRRHSLYSGIQFRNIPRLTIGKPRVLIEYDQWNDEAKIIAKQLESIIDSDDPNVIVVIGGDGTMLHAIKKYWRLRVPFFGINTGNKGFLLNHVKESFSPVLLESELMVRTSPLLHGTVETVSGEKKEGLAFNDVWVQAEHGKAAWIEVSIDGTVRLEKCIGDGILLATAAGSTAYARAIGGTPVPVGTPILTLVGSNLMEPYNWKSAHLPLHSHVSLRSIDPTPHPKKRPLYGFIDGIPQGEILSLHTRTSRIAAVELAFLPDHDLAERLARIQFPS